MEQRPQATPAAPVRLERVARPPDIGRLVDAAARVVAEALAERHGAVIWDEAGTGAGGRGELRVPGS